MVRLILYCGANATKIHLLCVDPGPETGWDNWEFFPGPTALGGGGMGAHREGNFFLVLKKEKIENFWIEKMTFRLT